MTAKICLNMIVKNESKNILRCLRSVKSTIDCWAITDTGSTDGTQELILDFFRSRNIPGYLYRHTFVDFSNARNQALANAEDSNLEFDYHLLVDADMVWTGHLETTDLTAYSYALMQKDKPSGAEYFNIRLVKRGIGATYVGVTHEYIDIGNCPVPALHGGMFIDFADGANRPGKFERDIKLLIAEVEKGPYGARSLFYLAQSYRDDGQLERAAECYRARLLMGNTWEEERWYAQLMYARLQHQLGNDPDGLLTKMAHETRPWRREPLQDLARYYLDKANAITDTKGDILFLEP